MKKNAATVPAPDVIQVASVSKRFTVRKDSSLKERIVTLGRAGRQHRQDFWGLSDVSLGINAGTTIGLIGHNGSGKSTLLKVLGGIVQPTSGTVHQRGRVAALLELGAGFHPDLTGRENVFLYGAVLGLSREETEAQFAAILEFSGVGAFIDTQVKFYSSGMYVRLAFAIAVHTDPDILLVDEVLAVGDEQFQQKCLDKIKEFQAEGRTIIIVSHALDQISALCDRVVVMDKGKLVYDGIPVTAIERFRELLSQNAIGQERPEQISRALEIRSVTVRDASGAEIAEVRPGQELALEVDVEMVRPIERWAIGFSVDSSLGQIALASNTDLLDIELAPLHSSRTVTICFTTDGLSPGTYSVNVNASGISEPTSHGLMNGAEFEILGEVRSVGPVATSVRIA